MLSINFECYFLISGKIVLFFIAYEAFEFKYISELKEIIVLIIGILNENAYDLTIKKEIENQLERMVSMRWLHTG